MSHISYTSCSGSELKCRGLNKFHGMHIDVDQQMYIHSAKQLETSPKSVAKNKKKKRKKDAQLVLRLNKELRDRFVEACQDLDTTSAREVRRFIKRFLKKYESGELDE